MVLYHQNEEMKINYEDTFQKLKYILNNWQNKILTLPRNIIIIRKLAASQLVYILSSLRTRFQSLKEINDLPLQFLWDGQMMARYGDGGQKIVDIMAFNKCL